MESNNEFEYTGKGCVVPKNVTSVLFHPSVVEVEYAAFRGCNNLKGVILNDGLQTIGMSAFFGCETHFHQLLLILVITHLVFAII